MSTESSYIPGMCNINKAEVAYRRKAMWFGVLLSVVVLAVCLVFHILWWMTAILLFVPVYIAAIGYLQVKNKFCVSYGGSGKQNADDGSAAALAVADEEAKKADKAKSRKMNLQALAITLAVLAAISFVLIVF